MEATLPPLYTLASRTCQRIVERIDAGCRDAQTCLAILARTLTAIVGNDDRVSPPERELANLARACVESLMDRPVTRDQAVALHRLIDDHLGSGRTSCDRRTEAFRLAESLGVGRGVGGLH